MGNKKSKKPKDNNNYAHGLWEVYDDFGMIIYRCNYIHSKEHGLSEHFFYADEINKILSKGYFTQGKKIGLWLVRYNGTLNKNYYIL